MTGESGNVTPKTENDDVVASTSKRVAQFLFGPPALNFLNNENNIIANSFNPMDVNSADDVRQTVKAAQASQSKTQNQQKTEPDQESVKSAPDTNKTTEKDTNKKDSGRGEPHSSKQKQHKKRRRPQDKLENREKKENNQDRRHVGQKRRGRPPKAGPSKKARRMSPSDFYTGKLSNYVKYERNSDSDSDLDSCLYG